MKKLFASIMTLAAISISAQELEPLSAPEIVSCGAIKKLSHSISSQNVLITVLFKKGVSAEYDNGEMIDARTFKRIPVTIRYSHPYLEEDQMAGLAMYQILNLAKGSNQVACVSSVVKDNRSAAPLSFKIFNYVGIGRNIEGAIQSLVESH